MKQFSLILSAMLAPIRAGALSWLVASTVAFAPCDAVAAPAEANRLEARVAADHVYVDFAADPIAIRQFDSRLSGGTPVMVTWLVDLRRVTRNWRDPRMGHATVQVIVRSAPGGLFEVHRRFDGQQAEATQVVDRETAYNLMSSFRLPLFSTDVPPGVYEVTVRAKVNGGGKPEIATPILAKADVEP